MNSTPSASLSTLTSDPLGACSEKQRKAIDLSLKHLCGVPQNASSSIMPGIQLQPFHDHSGLLMANLEGCVMPGIIVQNPGAKISQCRWEAAERKNARLQKRLEELNITTTTYSMSEDCESFCSDMREHVVLGPKSWEESSFITCEELRNHHEWKGFMDGYPTSEEGEEHTLDDFEDTVATFKDHESFRPRASPVLHPKVDGTCGINRVFDRLLDCFDIQAKDMPMVRDDGEVWKLDSFDDEEIKGLAWLFPCWDDETVDGFDMHSVADLTLYQNGSGSLNRSTDTESTSYVGQVFDGLEMEHPTPPRVLKIVSGDDSTLLTCETSPSSSKKGRQRLT